MESSNTVIKHTPRKSLSSNLSWALASKFIELFSGLLSGIVIARGLKAESYGLYTYIVAFYSIFFVFSTFGLEPILMRELSKPNRNRAIFLGSASILQFGILLLLIPVTLLFFWSTKESLQFKLGGTILTLSTFFVFDRFFHSLLVADLKNKKDGSIQVITKLLFFGLRISVFFFQPKLLTFLWVLFAENGFRFLYYYLSYRKIYYLKILKWQIDFRVTRIIFMHALPLLSAGILTILFQRIDLLMIGSIISKSTCGQYSIATIFLAVVIFVPVMIRQTVYPILVQSYKTNQTQFNRQISLLFNATFWYAVIISIVGYFTLPILLKFIYGKEFETAASLSQIVVWQIPFLTMAITSDQWIILKNLQRKAPIRHASGLLVNITLNCILIPSIGEIGAAISSIFAYLFSGYICNFFMPSLQELWQLQNDAMSFKQTKNTLKTLIAYKRRNSQSINR